MNKHLTILILILLSGITGSAQNKTLTADDEKTMKSAGEGIDTTGWIYSGTFGINSTQTYLKNWAAGGQSAVTVGGMLHYTLNYKKDNDAWDNMLDMAYGILLQDINSRAIKTDDKFNVTSKYGRKASENWYYAGLFNFRTQMAPGYEVVDGLPNYSNKISDRFAPANMLVAIGMDYKPSDKLSVFLSPITYRLIIVADSALASAGAFGVQGREVDALGNVIKEYETTRTEIGGYGRVEFKTPITPNIGYSTKLELFTNYLDNPQNVDMSWENLISLKVESWLTFTLFTQMIYDDNTQIDKGIIRKEVNEQGELINEVHDIGPGLQFKQVSGLNVSFKF